jgi:hypothetical protein
MAFRKRILLAVLMCFFSHFSKAQYITIPDPNFVSWLKSNGYLSCFIGNQLDTTCNAVLTAKSIRCYGANISDLTGIIYFDSLDSLLCYNNVLTVLPKLSDSISVINCSNNQLTTIVSLPDTLKYLRINSNPNLKCLPSVLRIDNFEWALTGINCLPNVISIGTAIPSINNIPICDPININNCQVYWNITGKVFSDLNSNCIPEITELKKPGIKINLFQNAALLQQTFSRSMGQYSFDTDTGFYNCSAEIFALPYTTDCPLTFSHSAYVTPVNPFHDNKDFSIVCKPGFDVGVLSLRNDRVFFPDVEVNVSVIAGDISTLYGLNCASGVSGTVMVVIQGPASYSGSITGALTPLVNGDTLLFTVNDFGVVDMLEDFRFKVKVDTSAQVGQQLCFHMIVLPLSLDNNVTNNYYTHCFSIVNSHDPNDKVVSPTNEIDTSQYNLTYTINFQNTGNAPAQHVRILDTLDTNIDESTFQLLSYSHEPQVQIIGKNVKFIFQGINLPDSISNEPASHGFVQYRVKRMNNLPIGTQIRNTAYIYFDFNPPIQTNTTINEIALTSGVGLGENQNPILFSIFPNPLTSGQLLNIYFNSSEMKKAEFSVYDLSGRKLFTQFVNASEQSQQLNLPSLSPGIYLVIVNEGNYITQQKLVVMK